MLYLTGWINILQYDHMYLEMFLILNPTMQFQYLLISNQALAAEPEVVAQFEERAPEQPLRPETPINDPEFCNKSAQIEPLSRQQNSQFNRDMQK